jgi:carbon storage regulator CsrA
VAIFKEPDMLVLSRKPNEKLIFPTLGVTVQVLEIEGGGVVLGIDAPPAVGVRREEVQPAGRAAAELGCNHRADQLHDRLRTTSMGLGLLRLQLDAGLADEARATLDVLHGELQVILRGVAGKLKNQPLLRSVAVPKRQKALLVEDNVNERELLAALLRRGGLQVDTAGDGADALDYLRSGAKPDVVLLDMGLPRVDGPTTVREIRRDPALAGLKIFGVSGHAPGEFDLAPGSAGVDCWFQKPVDSTALLHGLTAALETCMG